VSEVVSPAVHRPRSVSRPQRRALLGGSCCHPERSAAESKDLFSLFIIHYSFFIFHLSPPPAKIFPKKTLKKEKIMLDIWYRFC
jgi:hypothetical protein